MKTNNTYLHFVAYKGLGRWDVKSLRNHHLHFAFPCCTLGQVLSVAKTTWVNIEDNKQYPILGVHAHGEGVYINNISKGKDLTMKKYQKSLPNHLFYCKVRTVNGQWGVVYPQYADSYGSSNMQYLAIDTNKVIPEYLECLLKIRSLTNEWDKNAIGADGRHFPLRTLLNLQIPLPSLAEQQALVDAYNHNLQQATDFEQQAENGEKEIDTRIREHLQFSISMPCCKKGLNMVRYKETSRWDPSFFFSKKQINSSYPLAFVEQCVLNFMTDASGKSLRRETSKTPAKEYTYIGMENVEKNKGTLTSPPLVKGNAIKSQTIAVPNGYMIYGKLRPYLNKYWLNVTDTPNIVCSSEFFVFDIKATLNKLYFEYILASSIIQEQILNITSGARMPRINEDVFYNLSIPLPPLDVQAEIVAEVQAQRAKIADYKTTAATLRKDAITQFEQAIFE